jgi:periplasmic copper chaperone A
VATHTDIYLTKGNLMKHTAKLCVALLAATLSTTLWAQNVEVTDAWARATVQGQQATGAFMKLTAKEGTRLVAVSSSVAGVAGVHEMALDNNVMKMRAIAGLDLPAGKAVELKPGSYHIMLMDLKTPLQKDTTIPLTLVFKDAKGVETKADIRVPVSQMAPAGGHGGHDAHGAMDAPKGTDAEQITAAMKKQFDRPDAPLTVTPVTVEGDYAVAGWTQTGKGGRAMLQKDKGVWVIAVCAGDGLKDAKVLQTTGMNAVTAGKLAKAVNASESKLSKNTLKLFASFEGMVKIDAVEGHGEHGAHDGHGK